MIIRKKLISFRQRTTAGNIYLPHEVEFKQETYGSLEQSDSYLVPLDKIAASGRTTFETDGIWIDLKIWSNPYGAEFARLFESGYHLKPIGTGRIDGEGVIRDFVLHHFCLTKNPLWNDNVPKQRKGSSRNTRC